MPISRDKQFNILSNAIGRVLIPVMLCMALSIWFVNSLGPHEGDGKRCIPDNTKPPLQEIDFEPGVPSSSSSSSGSSNAVVIGFIAIFLALIVALTFLMVWLYKSGRRRVIQIWLYISVFLVLAYVGGIYIFDFNRSHCIDLDWFSLVFIIWNFSIGGLFAVFGRVPRFLNQAYLIVISSLMAYIFRNLPGFSIWIILGALVVWDLFAVLSPHGPLNLMVKAARERDDELPALVYDTNPEAPGRQPHTKPSKASSYRPRQRQATTSSSSRPIDSTTATVGTPAPSSAPNTTSSPSPIDSTLAPTSPSPSTNISGSPTSPSGNEAINTSVSNSATIPPPAASSSRMKKSGGFFQGLFRREKDGNDDDPMDVNDILGDGENNGNSVDPSSKTDGGLALSEDGEIKIGTLGTHLKLGLGDFVFYSILVAEASKSGPMTTIASFVAILAGLCATLFLVTVMRKALPALPISITAGLAIYFLTQYTVRPFVDNLLPELLFY